jgi:diguanylate cyclase (GGDEF)-like protein
VSFTTLYLWQGIGAVASAFAQAATILLILFVNTLVRLGFLYALASSLFCLADGAAFLYYDPSLTAPEKSTCFALVFTAVVFTLVANYWMERDERRSYLLRMQVEQRGRELAAANQELSRLSNLDALTGLGNRRYFSISFDRAWDEVTSTQTPLSLLLIDVDRFKKINDAFGHLFGDEILIRLSAMLRNASRREEDVVARYGGEEFIVLLPGIEMDEALAVADRLRRLAKTLELPPPNGQASSAVTISVGVASTGPEHYCQPDELIRDADLALYRAKSHGRDRVWCATSEDSGFREYATSELIEETTLRGLRTA